MTFITLILSILFNLQTADTNMNSNNIYDININLLDASKLNWEDYKGKKILIVNVASECGYTPQYTNLQELTDTYGESLVVLGVPCNDFGGQEPGDAGEIQQFCSTKYRVTFPMTEKVAISKNTHPLYQWLTQKTENGVSNHEVKWNFTKFLINSDGTLHTSYPSSVDPLDDKILNWAKG